jgi:hypothetical protein
MRYRLRTLLIFLAIGPPIIAWCVWPRMREVYIAWQSRDAVPKAKPVIVPTGGASALRASSLQLFYARVADSQAELARLEAELAGHLEARSQISEKLRENMERLRAGLQPIRPIDPTFPLQSVNREDLDLPGALRFSPEIERAMLHEGSQRN